MSVFEININKTNPTALNLYTQKYTYTHWAIIAYNILCYIKIHTSQQIVVGFVDLFS